MTLPIQTTETVTSKSRIRQLVDIVQSDIANIDTDNEITNTRRKYEVFVTGGIDLHGVTSSLYQTVYDQDFTLQTANPMFDITVGLFQGSSTVTECSTGEDTSGKLLFPSQSLMMREKIGMYRQFALNLLGDSTKPFTAPLNSNDTDTANRIDEAVFLSFKRLFVRDNILRGTFTFALNKDTTDSEGANVENLYLVKNTTDTTYRTNASSAEQMVHPVGGEVGTIRDTSADSNVCGLIFYDTGIMVLDASKVFNTNQPLKGPISSVNPNGYTDTASSIVISPGQELLDGNIIPDLFVSGSIDDVIDHVAGSRFSNNPKTAITFQNETFINSKIYFCRAAPSQFNYSSNPTYRDETGKIRVVDDSNNQPFTYVTTIGLYNENDELLAIAKTSRPIEKNPETDLSIRVRLDY